MFSHCFRNIIDFWIAKRRGRGEKDENLLAARALVFVLDNVYFCGIKTERRNAWRFIQQPKKMIKMTKVLKIICLIALVIVGCGTFELLQYGKAIQEETRMRLQKEKDYFLGLEFEGVVVEKNNVFVKKKHEDKYSVTLLLHQIEPKPSFPYNSNIYFDYTCDSLLTIHIPQNVYNQIKEGDTVKKEVNDCNVVIGCK